MATITNLRELLTNDAQLQQRVTTAISRNNPYALAVQEDNALTDIEPNQAHLAHLLELSVNGVTDIKEQKVIVEYLRNDQRLLIPTALGSPITGVGRCAPHATLAARYAKVTTMNYAAIRATVSESQPSAHVRNIVDMIVAPEITARKTDWLADDWYATEDGDIEEQRYVDVMIATFSQKLQFNCDIRDYGLLNELTMQVADDAWANIQGVQSDRLRNRLHPFSLQSIAALNLPAVGSVALAAWVRAYGLGMGLLPSQTSGSVKEYAYTAAQANPDHRDVVVKYDLDYERPMISLCANILAMFGLFHLNKDHTFRTNDQNMERIGKSYINTLRTDSTAATIDYMVSNMEHIVRTCAHPFALAQTYWLAKVMHSLDYLMSPLAIRLDTSPPPVQRAMICEATVIEWEGITAGKAVIGLFVNEIAVIRTFCDQVRENPPAYSSLSKLYGLGEPILMPPTVKDSVAAMMPAVSGYISATHVNEDNTRDGLGYALSLQNVQRDSRSMVMVWTGAWEKYVNSLDTMGIIDFVTELTVQRQAAPGL